MTSCEQRSAVHNVKDSASSRIRISRCKKISLERIASTPVQRLTWVNLKNFNSRSCMDGRPASLLLLSSHDFSYIDPVKGGNERFYATVRVKVFDLR